MSMNVQYQMVAVNTFASAVKLAITANVHMDTILALIISHV